MENPLCLCVFILVPVQTWNKIPDLEQDPCSALGSTKGTVQRELSNGNCPEGTVQRELSNGTVQWNCPEGTVQRNLSVLLEVTSTGCHDVWHYCADGSLLYVKQNRKPCHVVLHGQKEPNTGVYWHEEEQVTISDMSG